MTDKTLQPPQWLDPVAKKLYRDIAKTLPPSAGESELQRQTLALLCDSYSTYRSCAEILSKEGFSVQSGSTIKMHPAAIAQKTAAQQFLQVAKQLDLFESKQDKIESTGDDEIDELLGRLAG